LAVEKGLLVFSGTGGCRWAVSAALQNIRRQRLPAIGGRVGSLPSRGIKLVRSRIMKEIAELMPVRRCGFCEVSTGEESMSVMAMFRQSFQV